MEVSKAYANQTTHVPGKSCRSPCCFQPLAGARLRAINGDVKGVDGKPVVGAQIKIERKHQRVMVKTDKKGHYYYGGLGLGVYDVTVEVDGKTSMR